MKKLALVCILLSILFSCASQKPIVWISPNMQPPTGHVILPFVDTNSSENKKDYPEATEVVRDSFENEFLALFKSHDR